MQNRSSSGIGVVEGRMPASIATDGWSKALRLWPSISAQVFLRAWVPTTYPLLRRKSRVWREEHYCKLRKSGSRSNSVASTPPAEQDLDLEEFLEAMDLTEIEPLSDDEYPSKASAKPMSRPRSSESVAGPKVAIPTPATDSDQGHQRGQAESPDTAVLELSPISSMSSDADAMESEEVLSISFRAPHAHRVCVAGSFSEWNQIKLRREGNEQWETNLHVKPGVYPYKLVVDEGWTVDPTREQVRDEGGNANNIVRVGEVPAVFSWTGDRPKRSAYVAGSFSAWEKVPLKRQEGGVWSVRLTVPIGRHDFKYCIDDQWRVDRSRQVRHDEHGNENNSTLVGCQDKRFTYKAADGRRVHRVCVACSFNGWKMIELERGSGGIFQAVLPLEFGEYEFKFIVDGVWQCDPRWPRRLDPHGNENNFFFHGV